MTQYERTDHRVDIVAYAERAVLTLSERGKPHARSTLPRLLLDEAAEGALAPLAMALRRVAQPLGRLRADHWDFVLPRVALATAEPRWAAIAWESLIPADACFVRISDVRPRIAQIPLTFPIRILEAGGEPVVPTALHTVFGDSDRSNALLDAFCPLEGVRQAPLEHQWPTVEVLHLKGFDPSGKATEAPLKWLASFVERYQVRLMILEVAKDALPAARLLAHGLVSRSGPAVWVSAQGATDWQNEYGYIVHDRPLDWIRSIVKRGELFGGAGREDLLRYSTIASEFQRTQVQTEFAATTSIFERRAPRIVDRRPERVVREAIDSAIDSLKLTRGRTRAGRSMFVMPAGKADRFSAAVSTALSRQGWHASRLDDLMVQSMRLNWPNMRAEPWRQSNVQLDVLSNVVAADAKPLDALDRETAFASMATRLDTISSLAPTLRFEDHEREGMLPLAARVTEARALRQALGAEEVATAQSPETNRRHVNAAFFGTLESGELPLLDARTTRLESGGLVHFGVRIGRKDLRLPTVGSTALIEEIDRSQEAVELEIGLTAIDFECIGDPVQSLRLAPHLDSDWVRFAVRPRKTTRVKGVARLRFSLFHQNNVAQSFMVAALLTEPPTNVVKAVSHALNVEPGEIKRLGEFGYVTRMEYSANDLAEGDTPAPRALSMVANQSAGEKIITIKGEELFHVTNDRNLPLLVEAMRKALDAASAGGKPDEYRYVVGQDNAGDPNDLADTLWEIARAGWNMFNALVPTPEGQQQVRDALASGSGIHAAHIDATSVIPWALIYDRQVRDRKSVIDPAGHNQRLVERALCTASMPATDGSMSELACGVSERCLLHRGEIMRRRAAGAPTLLKETVICPRRFWGFSVPIDVPAQQQSGVGGAPPPPVKTLIDADAPPAIVAGFNPHLTFTAAHRNKLSELAKSPLGSLVTSPISGRDALIDLLDTQQPDVLYLFCHALASLKGDKRTIGPSLDLARGFEGVIDDVMEPSDFAGDQWKHGPLVFINGCATVGFSPYAPSMFIKQFIQGRGASAVVGTEVTVWELLATEFAVEFFRRFLGGVSAGRALLEARRVLLAKNNPLGLVYTLYGSADLTVGRKQDRTALARGGSN